MKPIRLIHAHVSLSQAKIQGGKNTLNISFAGEKKDVELMKELLNEARKQKMQLYDFLPIHIFYPSGTNIYYKEIYE